MANFLFEKIDIPGGNGVNISINGVDAAGVAVGNYGNVDNDGVFHGLIAPKGGTTTTFDPAASSNTDIVGVTDGGEIFGDYTDWSNKQHGFVVDNGVTTTIDFPSATATTLSGENAAGELFGSFVSFQTVSGFTDTNGVFAIVDDPGASSTSIAGVNASGEIVGGITESDDSVHGFIDKNGSFTTIDPPGSNYTGVVGVSDAGEIVGDYQDSADTQHGFVDNNGVISTLDVPGAVETGIDYISNSGVIVGYYYDGAAIHGFIDRNGNITKIDVPGATDTEIQGVNTAGEIFGFYQDGTGQHGFVGIPGPTLDNVAPTVAFTEGGGTVTLSPGATLSDTHSSTLISATVSVSGGFAGDGDVLGFTTAGTSITASYDAAAELLTLTGTDTLAHYQNVLDSVAFASGADPTNSGGNPTRTVTWTVDDGSASNNLGTATTTISFPPVLSFIGIGDFDANSRSDIAWASNGGGRATMWMNANGALTQDAVPLAHMGAEWTAYGVGDFNGDGKSDILWTSTTGQTAVWEMNGPNLVGFGVPAGQMGSEWHVAAIGDFNGDGKSDLLWVDNAGGHAAMWTMNGTVMSGFSLTNGAMGAEWSVLGAGDFNQDGRADVLWESSAGTVDIWEMNGANLSGFDANVGTAPGRFAGVGHFTPVGASGDRTSDIVWVDDSNHVTIWEMSGGHITNAVTLNGLDGTDWHLQGVGSFAGDANSDLLWVNHNTGAVNIWEVSGSNVTEIPVNAPTGSTLQLQTGLQSQAAAVTLSNPTDFAAGLTDGGKNTHTLAGS
jgi:hypothetical protein